MKMKKEEGTEEGKEEKEEEDGRPFLFQSTRAGRPCVLYLFLKFHTLVLIPP